MAELALQLQATVNRLMTDCVHLRCTCKCFSEGQFHFYTPHSVSAETQSPITAPLRQRMKFLYLTAHTFLRLFYSFQEASFIKG